jgi:hypothetical protein
MPLLIATLVDAVTFHRRIADWPRSILDGSTVNSATTGLPELVGPLLVDAGAGGGGGGGGIGVFFEQADAIRTITIARVRAAFFIGRSRKLVIIT